MNPYIMGAMLKHIALRIILLTTLTKDKDKGYDIKLVNVKEGEVIRCALLIAFIFATITIMLVSYVKGSNQNIIIASVLLSIGLGQQFISLAIDVITMNLNNFISRWNSIVYTLAKMRNGDEWKYIENESSKIFIYPHIIHSLPSEIGFKTSFTRLTRYIVDKKDEANYPHTVYEFDSSLLSFAEYMIEYLHDKLVLYDYLTNLQQRTSNINPVIFIAVGTLIWLLS